MERPFIYWKRPWQRWAVAAAALLQLISLYLRISDYRQIAHILPNIMSPEEVQAYTANTVLSCAMTGFAALLFTGIFLIGALSRSKRGAKLGEVILLWVFAAVWGAAGLLLALQPQMKMLWLLILLAVMITAAVCTIKLKNYK